MVCPVFEEIPDLSEKLCSVSRKPIVSNGINVSKSVRAVGFECS
jgi:hypothetical protein